MFPESQPVPLFPFEFRVDNWTDGLVAKGFERDVAVLSTKSNNPSTPSQFQSVLKKAEFFFANQHLRLEDVSASFVVNFMGREFVDNSLATSTVLNHYYACIKPAKFKFNLNLDRDDDIKDVISGMKKERPGKRDSSVFLKLSLQGLFHYHNSDAFEPLENASFRVIQCKLLILVFLNTGRRNCKIAAIAGYYFHQGDVVFYWFPGVLAKMEKGFGKWKSDLPQELSYHSGQ